jgi:hypothetical protein
MGGKEGSLLGFDQKFPAFEAGSGIITATKKLWRIGLMETFSDVLGIKKC